MQVSSNDRVRRSENEWRGIVARFAKSGLSRRDFCLREKVNKNSFQRWQKRLAVSKQSEFIDVTPASAITGRSWTIEVELSDGTIVRVGS